MPSRALTMLWIVTLTLPNYFLGGTDEEDIIRFKTLGSKTFHQVKDVFLGELPYDGTEFIHPDDPNQILKIYKFAENGQSGNMANDQTAIKKLMAREKELGNVPPITQQLGRVLDIQFDEHKGISMEMDRYRGTLEAGMKYDRVLIRSLMDFSKRLDMYKQLAFIFQQMSALDMKFCNIDVDRVLYKKTGDDFSSKPLQDTDTEFNFVLTDFRFSTDLGTPCPGGKNNTWDRDDARDSIPKSDKCKGKIEIFGLGMLILKLETLFVMLTEDGSSLSMKGEISKAFVAMSEAPEDISKFYNDNVAILHNSPREILSEIWKWVLNANNDPDYLNIGDIVAWGGYLLPSTAYVEQANSLVFELRDMYRCPDLKGNQAVRGKVMKNYAAFNKLLQTMLQSNDYVNGRPTAAETITALTKIQQGYVANIQSLGRILLV